MKHQEISDFPQDIRKYIAEVERKAGFPFVRNCMPQTQ
jgi:hypothetical protein